MFRVFRFTVAATFVIACIQLTVWVIGCNDWNATGFFKDASNLQVRTCLITGSDISATDDKGRTPLHNSVVSLSYPPTDQFSALIAAGAEIKAMDADGLVPLRNVSTTLRQWPLEFRLGFLRLVLVD